MEPAAVLVRALEVHVAGVAQFAVLADAGEAHARVEPHVQNRVVLGELAAAALAGPLAFGQAAQQFLGGPGVPGVRAFALEDVGHVEDHVRIEQNLAALFAVEGDDGHAPDALAADAPVGPVLDHRVDAFLTPLRVPLHLFDFGQGLFAQAVLLHADEPLRRGAGDDRFLARLAVRARVVPPAVGVVVLEVGHGQQVADLLQLGHHLRVRIEHELPGEELHVLG